MFHAVTLHNLRQLLYSIDSYFLHNFHLNDNAGIAAISDKETKQRRVKTFINESNKKTDAEFPIDCEAKSGVRSDSDCSRDEHHEQ